MDLFTERVEGSVDFYLMLLQILFVAFGIHILLGGAYELRTLAAMVIRSFAWTMTVIILSSKKEV